MASTDPTPVSLASGAAATPSSISTNAHASTSAAAGAMTTTDAQTSLGGGERDGASARNSVETSAPMLTGVGTAGEEDAEGNITPPVPKCHLRIMIISGQTHIFSFEPELTVGRVKEIIWSSWPSEWTEPAAPPSPAFLRLLYSGRILQDDSTLGSNNIPTALSPKGATVMHISVRSFSLRGDEDPKKNGLVPSISRRSSRRRAAAQEDDAGGCKCVIM